jgi:hypothetical protein
MLPQSKTPIHHRRFIVENRDETRKDEKRFEIVKLEERIAPCSDHSGPPGLCGAGPPGTAPGNSNPPGGK